MNHVPIRILTLRPGSAVFFDVYVKVGEKLIHYIRRNEPFEENRLKKLKDSGVKKLFIPEEDEPKYLEYLDAGLDTLGDISKDTMQKGALAYDSLVTDSENVERNFETEQGYKGVSGRVSKVVDFLATDKAGLKSILVSAGVAADEFQHGANVASLSAALAVRVKGVTPRELMDLSLAALVHDIGKTKLDLPAGSTFETLDDAGKTTYKKHCERGVELLASKKFITPLILRLVQEHEEMGEGNGYPERKRFESLPVTSQILSLCNHFDRVSMAQKIPPVETMKYFFQEKAHLFDLDLITKLGEAILGK